MKNLLICTLLLFILLCGAFTVDLLAHAKKMASNHAPKNPTEIIETVNAMNIKRFNIEPTVDSQSVHIQNVAKVQSFLDNYGSTWNAEDFFGTSCKPEILIAIACRESSCGKNMTTQNNPGNVNNNDRGHRQSYNSFKKGVSKICDTLNNQYLGHTQQLYELSHATCGGCNKWYATDTSGTWAYDVAWFIGKITGENVDINYSFRN